MRMKIARIVMVLMISWLVGCAVGSPKWVTEGSSSLYENDEQAIYGVGAIVGVKNAPLAWDAAENRARAEVAKTFQVYTGYLMQDYASSTTAGSFTNSTEEQDVQRGIKTFTSSTLSGVRPVERFKDQEDDTYYVLVKLSIEQVKQTLANSRELNADVRDYVRENADRVFEKLEKEEIKRR